MTERDPQLDTVPEAPQKSLGERILEFAPMTHLRFTQCLYVLEKAFQGFIKDSLADFNIKKLC